MKAVKEIEQLLPEYLLRSETYSLVITDLEGRYIFVNEVFKKRFSFICNDFIGQPSLIAIYPDDHDKCLKAVEQVLQNPEKVVRVNLRKPDNNLSDFYWTEWEFSLFKDQDKNPIGILCLGHDITETEKASGQTKEFAQKVETIIEEITDGFYVLNREWEFIKINTVAEQILGIPREKLLGRKIWDLFPETPAYNYPAAYRKAMNEYVTVTFEDYRADIDRWFNAICYPSQEGLTVFFKDITEEKKKQFSLEDTRNKLHAILESTSDSYIFINPEYKILHFNAIAEIPLKSYLPTSSLKINADIRDYLLSESKEIFEKLFNKALKGEKTVIEVKRNIDGKDTWLEVHYLPVYEPDAQKLIGVTLKSIDVSIRKQKEIELEENKNRLNSTIEAIPHPLLIVNEQKQIEYVNDEFETIFGYTSKEVIGREVDFLLPERYRAGHRFLQEQYLKQPKTVKKMSRYLQALVKSGAEITVNASLNIFTIAGKKYVILILQDVTEQKKYQDTVIRQNELLRQIAWQESHELRRPVANILGICGLLKNYPNEPEEMKIKYIDYMLQATNELDKVIHKIVSQANEIEYEN